MPFQIYGDKIIFAIRIWFWKFKILNQRNKRKQMRFFPALFETDPHEVL